VLFGGVCSLSPKGVIEESLQKGVGLKRWITRGENLFALSINRKEKDYPQGKKVAPERKLLPMF